MAFYHFLLTDQKSFFINHNVDLLQVEGNIACNLFGVDYFLAIKEDQLNNLNISFVPLFFAFD